MSASIPIAISGVRKKRDRPVPTASFEPPSAIRRQPSSGNTSVTTNDSISGGNLTNNNGSAAQLDILKFYIGFVTDALDKKRKGDEVPYNELVTQFRTTPSLITSFAPIQSWVEALSHVISQLDRSHAVLVNAILAFPWTTASAEFASAYIRFVGLLLSARTEYAQVVLSRTVRGLNHETALKQFAQSDSSTTEPITRKIIYDRLHTLLQHLLRIIPTLPPTLLPIVLKVFPHKRENKLMQVTYTRNVLRIVEYCPSLGDDLLRAVLDRVIQIDVEIQVEMEDLDEEAADTADAAIFSTDPFDKALMDESSSDGSSDDQSDQMAFEDLSSDDEGSLVETPESVEHIRLMADKLDAMLGILFNHFQRIDRKAIDGNMANSRETIRSNSEMTSALQLRQAQFYALLSIFDRTIIRTFKSRYTQFLLFWYSSREPEFSDSFQGMLVGRALYDTDVPMVTRVAAASYIASFVSRAKFVLRDSCRRVVKLLSSWLVLKLEEDTALGSIKQIQGVGEHSLFYAVAQALFYIFCFRWRDLLLEETESDDDLFAAGGRSWAPGLDSVQRIISSHFNPLKYCSAAVVKQFARVAHSTTFLYCDPIIAHNNRSINGSGNMSLPTDLSTPSKRSQPAEVVRQSLAEEDLDSFFPFDPYKLKGSSVFLDGLYREWNEVAIEGESDEDEDEDEDDEESELDGTEELLDEYAPTGGIDIKVKRGSGGDALGRSMEAMSLSPIDAWHNTVST